MNMILFQTHNLLSTLNIIYIPQISNFLYIFRNKNMKISKTNTRAKRAPQKAELEVIQMDDQLTNLQLVNPVKSKFLQGLPDPSSIKLDQTLQNVSQVVQQKAREQCRLIITLIVTNLVTSTLTVGANYLMSKYLPFSIPTAATSKTSTSVSFNPQYNLTGVDSESLSLEMFSSGWTNLQVPYLFEEFYELNYQQKIASFENIVSVNLDAKFVKILAIQQFQSLASQSNLKENWTKVTVKNGLTTFVHWLHSSKDQTVKQRTQNFVIPCESTRQIRIKKEPETPTKMKIRFYVTAYKE